MVELIKTIIKKNNTLYKIALYLLDAKNTYYLKKRKKHFEEKRCSWGRENPDKTFYVIRRSDVYVGLASIISVILGRIVEAEKNGWIPVVDLKYEKSAYLEDEEVGKSDAWAYYFKPLCGYGIDDIKRSKNIILSNGGAGIELLKPIDFDKEYNQELFNNWKRITNNYLHFNDDILHFMDQEYSALFTVQDRVLGVLARGTDYVARKPHDHPVQPQPEQIFGKAWEVMKGHYCNRIFLATEDKKIYHKFIAEFGEDIIRTNKKSWVDYKGDLLLSEFRDERENGRYLNGLDYLTALYILSKCNCFIGGRTSATPLVMCLAERMEYTFFWDLGVY